MRLYTSLFSILALVVSVSAVDRCSKIPSSFWCQNADLEKECGFTQLCDRYRAATKNQPVKITLLMEGLCPGCQAFLTEVLYPKVFKNFGKYVNIEIVPYGNAKIVDDVIQCQHGEDECRINKFESCLIDATQDQNQFVPIINCIETQLKNKVVFEEATEKCFTSLSVGQDVQRMIQSCLVSNLGTKLQLAAAKRTNDVWPDKHSHVPWILINDVSIGKAQLLMDDLPEMICQWYNGDSEIPYCKREEKKLRTFMTTPKSYNKVVFEEATEKCFSSLSVEQEIQRMIQSCLVSNLGTKLQLAAAKRTNDVWPDKHSHVPWILINDVSIGKAQLLMDDLPEMIGQWYNGDSEIPYCKREEKKLRTFMTTPKSYVHVPNY